MLEAFLCAQYDSNYNKWNKMMDYYKEQKSYNAPLPPPKRGPDGKRVPDPLHDAKYTDKNSGQCKYGCYAEEGIQFFVGILNRIVERKKKNKADVAGYEKDFLNNIRKKDGIEGDSAAQNKEIKKNKRAAGSGKAPKKKRARVEIIVDSDDEE